MDNKKVSKLFQGKLMIATIVLWACLGVAGCQNNQQVVEDQQAFRQVGINKMNEGDYAGAVDAFQKA